MCKHEGLQEGSVECEDVGRKCSFHADKGVSHKEAPSQDLGVFQSSLGLHNGCFQHPGNMERVGG